MFKKWLESQVAPSWDQLLRALRSRSVQLIALADKIDNMLIGSGKYINYLKVTFVVMATVYSYCNHMRMYVCIYVHMYLQMLCTLNPNNAHAAIIYTYIQC